LAALINNHFGPSTAAAPPKFAVWSSVLTRAQETAFYQLAGPANTPINVVPYVGEKCKATGKYCGENRPLSKDEQNAAHSRRNLGVYQRLTRGVDYRTIVDTDPGFAAPDAAVSDEKKFFAWLTKKRLEHFASAGKVTKVGKEEYNVVLFTHSNFIKSAFGAVKIEISNNAAFYIRLGDGEHVVQESGRDKFKVAKGINSKKAAKTVQKAMKKAEKKYTAAVEKASDGTEASQEKSQDAKVAFMKAQEAFRTVDLERFGIANLKLNPDARIMVAPYLFTTQPGFASGTSGCPRLTKCAYDKTCTSELTFVAAPDSKKRHPCEYAYGNEFIDLSAKGPDATALAVPDKPFAHVPRMEIDPTRGSFGAYKFTLAPDSVCAPYAKLRAASAGERTLNQAWNIIEDPNAKV
jgi:hypothetical protein